MQIFNGSERLVLCDWTDTVKHYRLPDQFRNQLEELVHKNNRRLEFIKPNTSIKKFEDNVEIYIGNTPPRDILLSNNLKWIHFGSVGTDRIQIKDAIQKNVFITNSASIFDHAVSQHALSFVLSLFNVIPGILLNDGDFTRASWEKSVPKYNSSRVHILGYGNIAQTLVRKLNQLKINVVAYTRDPNKYSEQNNVECKIKGFAELCDSSFNANDIVVNLLPGSIEAQKAVKEVFSFQNIKIYGYINLGRKENDNLKQIEEMLSSGKIQYCIWDVIRDDNQRMYLKKMFSNRVFFTPHVASFGCYAWDNLWELLQNNLESYLKGRPDEMRNLVNE